MPAGLMVRVKNGTGLGSLFHPTLPFSYIVGTIDITGNWGPNVHSFSATFEAPFPLNKPWFTLKATTAYNVGSYYVEKVAGTVKTYKVTGERYITLIDPRNGYTYWLNPDQPLLAGARITIGDIRG